MNWMPIETAPQDGTPILAWPIFGRVDLAWFGVDLNADAEPPMWLCGDGDGFSVGYYFTPCAPTHWMPLPEPPEGA